MINQRITRLEKLAPKAGGDVLFINGTTDIDLQKPTKYRWVNDVPRPKRVNDGPK